jgi:hypothetical protein
MALLLLRIIICTILALVTSASRTWPLAMHAACEL